MAKKQVLIIVRLSSLAEGSGGAASLKAALEQIGKDPRVTASWALAGESSGCCLLVEVGCLEEAEVIASFLQLAAPTVTRLLPLVSAQQLLAGLREAERIGSSDGHQPPA